MRAPTRHDRTARAARGSRRVPDPPALVAVNRIILLAGVEQFAEPVVDLSHRSLFRAEGLGQRSARDLRDHIGGLRQRCFDIDAARQRFLQGALGGREVCTSGSNRLLGSRESALRARRAVTEAAKWSSLG